MSQKESLWSIDPFLFYIDELKIFMINRQLPLMQMSLRCALNKAVQTGMAIKTPATISTKPFIVIIEPIKKEIALPCVNCAI